MKALQWPVRAVAWFALMGGFIALGAPMMAWLGGPEQAALWHKIVHSLGGRAGAVLVGLALVLLAMALRPVLLRWRQAGNDGRAAHIMATLRHDASARVDPFYLYLRAFETTGRLRAPLFVRLRRLSLAAHRGVTDDIESYVGQAVRSIAPLIALGRPGEAVGAGRIQTADATWQADIDLLIQRAQAVLLVPSERPGTRWEIEKLLREGLLPKVVFVMPPRSAEGGYDTQARWEVARTSLASLGVELPPYDPDGLLFELSAQGRLLQAEPLLPHDERAMRISLQRLLDPAPPAQTLEKTLAQAQRRGRRAAFWGWAETARQLSPYALALLAPLAPGPGPDFDPAMDWWSTLQVGAPGSPVR